MTDEPERPDSPNEPTEHDSRSGKRPEPDTPDEVEPFNPEVSGTHVPTVPEVDESPSSEESAQEDLPSNVEMEEVEGDDEVESRLRRLSRRGFLTMAAAAGAGYAGWKWLDTRPGIDRRPWPYRRVLEANERLAMAYYDRDRLSPTFPPDRIEPLRPNGRIGLMPDQRIEGWTVTIHGVAGTNGPVEVPLSEIHRLPGYEMITELRCIEGWSRINRWTGTQLLELMSRYPPATRDGSPPDFVKRPERLVRYVSIETPGRGYYVGLDMASAIHPQTMLVWEMNGEPVDWLHGAPLRLGIPVKYGIKNIKRIATIRYLDRRPADYWAERGYDWYAGF